MPAAPLVVRPSYMIVVSRQLPRCASQVLDRGAQVDARGAAKIRHDGFQAVARGAARCASQIPDRGVQATLVTFG
jgi:hypothetical protein